MNKCLVVKLPVSIDNDNLERFNEAIFPVSNSSQTISFDGGTDNYIRIIGDGTFNSFTDQDKVSHAGESEVHNVVSASAKVNNPSNSLMLGFYNCLELVSFGQLNSIRYDKDNYDFFANLKKCPKLQSINVYGDVYYNDSTMNISKVIKKYNKGLTLLRCNFAGELSDISNFTDMTTLAVRNFTGSLADITNLTKLTELNLAHGKVTGDIAVYAKEVAKAKYAHILRFNTNGIITNGSETPTNNTLLTITFSADGTYTIA